MKILEVPGQHSNHKVNDKQADNTWYVGTLQGCITRSPKPRFSANAYVIFRSQECKDVNCRGPMIEPCGTPNSVE